MKLGPLRNKDESCFFLGLERGYLCLMLCVTRSFNEKVPVSLECSSYGLMRLSPRSRDVYASRMYLRQGPLERAKHCSWSGMLLEGMCVCVWPYCFGSPVITEDANNKQLQGHVICLTRGFYFKRTYSKRRSLKD